MKSIIVITQQRIDVGKISDDFKNYGVSYQDSDGRLVVEGTSGWFAFNVNDSLLQDYEEGEIRLLNQCFSNFFLSHLEFSTLDAVNYAMNHMSIPNNSLVDNDHGLITSVSEIRDMIRRSIDWSRLSCNGGD